MRLFLPAVFFVLFFGCVDIVHAAITKEESGQLLGMQFTEQSEKNIDAYTQAINAGMTNAQAMDNIQKIKNLTPDSPAPVTITGGRWAYVGDVLVFTQSDAFIPAVPEEKRNTDYTKRRINGIEEVVDESQSYARGYNDAFDSLKKSVNNSEIAGTPIGDLLLRKYRENVPSISNRVRYSSTMPQRTSSMEREAELGLANEIARVASEHNLDINDVTGYESSYQIPGGYDVKVRTANGTVYPPGPVDPPTPPDSPPVGGSGQGSGDGAGDSGGATGDGRGGGDVTGNNGGATDLSGASGTTADGGGDAAGGGIVPCGNGDDPDNACTICHLAKGTSNIIDFLMKTMVIVAFLIITVSGVMYIVSAGNPSMTTMAKSAVKNTVIGAIVMLTAFIMIQYALKALAVQSTGPLVGAAGNGGAGWDFRCDAAGTGIHSNGYESDLE